MIKLTRRNVILSGGAAAISTASLASAQTSSSQESQYNFTKPEDNLEAFVKVMGNLNGEPVWHSAQGQIYAQRPGELSIPILAVEGVRWTKFEKTEDGYLMSTRDWSFYKDVKTGKVIDTFENPFTGKNNATRQILTGVNLWPMSPENGQEVPGFEGDAWLMGKPFVLPWTVDGDDVSVPMELLVKYANGAAGGEIMNFMVSAAQLNDPALTSTDTRFQWTGDSGWIRWMDMGDIEGRTLWNSTGRKVSSVNQLRPYFLEMAEHYFPGSIADPEGYEKTSYTVSPPEIVSKKPE